MRKRKISVTARQMRAQEKTRGTKGSKRIAAVAPEAVVPKTPVRAPPKPGRREAREIGRQGHERVGRKLRRPRPRQILETMKAVVIRNGDQLKELHYPFDPARYEPATFPIDFLNTLPHLKNELVEGLRRATHAGHSPAHCRDHITSLKNVLVPFLERTGKSEVTFERLNRVLLGRLWDDYCASSPAVGVRTKWANFDNVQIILELTGVCDHIDWFEAPPTGDREPIKQRPAPDPVEMAAVIRCARTALVLQMDRLAALSKRSHKLLTDPVERRIVEGARKIRLACKGHPPPSYWYFPGREEVLAGITATEFHVMCSVWCPTRYDLMPAAILTAFDFRLDLQALSDMEFAKISPEETFGPKRTQVEVVKRRGKKTLRPSCPVDDEPDNPKQVFEFLREWTKPLRAQVASHPRDRDRVFIGQCIYRKQIASLGSHVNKTFTDFLERNSLPRMTFSQIRKGVIDTVSRLTAGDRAMKAVAAGHTTVRTGDTHYSDAQETARLAEALAQQSANRDRSRASKGRIDVRDQTSEDDPLAATPGWQCRSPYDGPPGYRSKTVPCAAYGYCPACIHGRPNLNSAYSFARVVDLKRAILESTDMPDDRWRGIWRPVVDLITEHWIPMFVNENPEIVASASELNLPPLPEVS